jgi:glucose-1-phosphate cytidylyltransferase|tara:strand:- start:402 stop:1106 length:705 start_codon:yes stop_codon:yes gene_type:complete
MQVVILAGGLGTRLSEETKIIPKALVKIGNKPIITHLINYYQSYGYNDFIICLGYKGDLIKSFFHKEKHKNYYKKLNIKLINTGQKSYTGERLKCVKKYIKGNFFLTYCDGLSNINIKKTLLFFNKSKKIGLVSTINPKSRFGVLSIDRYNNVLSFDEKIKNSNTWINAGFFIFTKEIFKFITEKNAIFERGPLVRLSKKKQLIAYKHKGFWQCMDTLKDKILLTEIWNKKKKF